MLQSLFIKDFIIIEKLEVSFEPSFTSITGETGAGKSVFVGALSMLMGKRADTTLIRHGADKSIIEGVFTNIPEKAKEIIASFDLEIGNPSECILRREISNSGRNRSFVNDTPTPLSTLEKIAEQLIDIHSQHRNLLLGDANYILSAVDRMLLDKTPLLHYQEIYKQYKTAEKNWKELRNKIEKASEEYDYDLFRFHELSDANLKEEEEKALEEEENYLRYADELKESFYLANQYLEGEEKNAIQLIQEAIHSLSSIAERLPNLSSYINRLESCTIELQDIASDCQRQSDEIEANPLRLQSIEERLNLINRLINKYRTTSTKELLILKEELAQKIALYKDGDTYLKEVESELNRKRKELDSAAQILHQARQEISTKMAIQIKETLASMEMPLSNVVFRLHMQEDPLPTGYDIANLLFSANENLPLKPVGEIASGGEMARLMLALKALLAQKEALPSILFDEIDTGISGRIADKMGQILLKMGINMQVIAITHLPQIAARGNHQMHIGKHLNEQGEPITSLQNLSPKEREKEIAALISGDTISQESLDAAKVLLKK